MKIKITVDPNLCIGAASCVTVSSETFQLNNENKAVVLEKGGQAAPADRTYERVLEVNEVERDRIILAAESCPVAAIAVFDAETGERLFPKS